MTKPIDPDTLEPYVKRHISALKLWKAIGVSFFALFLVLLFLSLLALRRAEDYRQVVEDREITIHELELELDALRSSR